MLVSTLCFAFFMSALVSHEHPLPDDESDEDDEFATQSDHWMWVTFSAVLVSAYEMLLVKLAVSPCCREGGSCFCICALCRDCLTETGTHTVEMLTVFSVILGFIGILLAVDAAKDPRLHLKFDECVAAARRRRRGAAAAAQSGARLFAPPRTCR